MGIGRPFRRIDLRHAKGDLTDLDLLPELIELFELLCVGAHKGCCEVDVALWDALESAEGREGAAVTNGGPEFRARAARHGRTVGFNMSVRPIIAATEGAAWDKATFILGGMTGSLGWARQEREGVRAPVDNAGQRQFALAQEKDVHDERLWMGITKATGALGNTSCLVGTAEQVPDSLLAYYRLGVSSFLMRGFDPVNDTIEFGRELIPRLRAGVLEIDRLQVADAG